MGPELERSNMGALQRKGFGTIMTHILTLSITLETLYEQKLPTSLLA